MKKLESTWYNMAIVLTGIALIAGAALASVNEITKEPIAQIKQTQLQDGIKFVLGGQALNVQKVDTLNEGAVIVYRTDKGNAVQASDPNGFGGTLTVLVGFGADGSIKGYTILESSETPGLGAKANEWFRQDGHSVIGMNPSKDNMTVKKDGGDVDAITASTITSRAFLRCINAAYAALSEQSSDAESGASKMNKK